MNKKININKMVLFFILLLLVLLFSAIVFFNKPLSEDDIVKENKLDNNVSNSSDGYKILVMMSSYKRPLLLSGQIIRFTKQTYKNFDVSVSIKGVSEKWVRRTFMQEWGELIDENRLFIRFDKNKDQLSNLLDTVRDIDINKYDYFCKMDDDDWYAPVYLEEVNEWLHKEEGIDVSYTPDTTVLRNGVDSAVMKLNSDLLFGPTLCFSRKVIKLVLEVEKDASVLEGVFPEASVEHLRHKREDTLLHEIAIRVGKEQYRKTSPYHMIFGQQYPSVMRKGYLPK